MNRVTIFFTIEESSNDNIIEANKVPMKKGERYLSCIEKKRKETLAKLNVENDIKLDDKSAGGIYCTMWGAYVINFGKINSEDII